MITPAAGNTPLSMSALTEPNPAELGFLASLRSALASFVAGLEQTSADPNLGANIAARLAVEHGVAVYRASLAWTEQAALALAARTAAAE